MLLLFQLATNNSEVKHKNEETKTISISEDNNDIIGVYKGHLSGIFLSLHLNDIISISSYVVQFKSVRFVETYIYFYT